MNYTTPSTIPTPILSIDRFNVTNDLLLQIINQTYNITNMQLEQINTLNYILHIVIVICVFVAFYVFLQLLNLVCSAAWR